MNKTAQILTILMIISHVAPAHTMDNNRPYFYAGLGTLGGAILGTLVYNELKAQYNENKPYAEKPNKPKENAKIQSRAKRVYAVIKTLGSAAVGAVIGAFALRALYWNSEHGREQTRIAQGQAQAAHANQIAIEQFRIAQEQAQAAQERDRVAQNQAAQVAQEQARVVQEQARPIRAAESIRNAQNNVFLNQNLNLQVPQEIEAAACRHYRHYPVLQAEREMAAHANNLQNARDFYHQAGDNVAEQQANQLMATAVDRAAALRQLPRYTNETQNEEISRTLTNIENNAQREAYRREEAHREHLNHERQEAARRAGVERDRLALERQRLQNEREEAERRARIDKQRLKQNYAYRY